MLKRVISFRVSPPLKTHRSLTSRTQKSLQTQNSSHILAGFSYQTLEIKFQVKKLHLFWLHKMRMNTHTHERSKEKKKLFRNSKQHWKKNLSVYNNKTFFFLLDFSSSFYGNLFNTYHNKEEWKWNETKGIGIFSERFLLHDEVLTIAAIVQHKNYTHAYENCIVGDLFLHRERFPYSSSVNIKSRARVQLPALLINIFFCVWREKENKKIF